MENLPTPTRKPSGFRRPAIVLNGAQKNSDSSSSDAIDDAHFRRPMAPIQMTISPGNAANDDKLAAKLKSLELSRKKVVVARSHPIDLKTPSKVDLVATEQFYVESSVENIPQTPRTQSIREPFRTPSHNVSTMNYPRDSMRSNATYVLTTPRLDRGLHPHNDPFTPLLVTPSRKTNTVSTPLAYDEKLERQFVALSSWANVILDSASFVSEIDLGTSKQDASRKLQEMLTKPMKKNAVVEGMKIRYTDMCLRKKCLDYLKRADSVYQSTPIPGMLKAMVEKGEINIKPNIEVYANLGVQTSILSLLFSLHPFWLFIGVETVCAEFNDHDTVSLDARLPFSSSSFAPATVRFIHDHILANAKYMSKKKFAIGTVKKIVTDKGKEVLHKHCITCILSMAVLLEYAKNSYLFENTPGLFVKNSEIKTVSDFCTEFSRLVLSASGTPLNKAFDKNSFRRTYRQSFLEEYQYVMKSVRDMSDGIILGRLIELLTDSSPLSIIGNMRNPQGDRLRKKGNVEKALSAASEAGIDVDGISIDQILAAHRESCLDLMWRLVGVYVKKKEEQEPLRRESLCLDGGTDTDEAGDDTVMIAPLGGIAESAFSVYQQLAFQFGLPLTKWADLEDGILLSSIWQHYNPSAPDVRFYDGQSLFDKVTNAAESDLGIPLALTALRDERQLGLFAHMFLSRLISYKRLRDSEMSDAESDASSIVSIIRKEGMNLSEETERIQRVRLESERAISAREEEQERRREDELKRRFEEEEEEERLHTEWRSPPRSPISVVQEERMLMNDGEEDRIEEEMRRAEQRMREEEARIEDERKMREYKEKLAEEQRIREEEDLRRIEEVERDLMRREMEKEEEERIRREEQARLDEERKKKEEDEERERIRLIEEARLKAEEEEKMRREEEERVRRIEEARIKAEEEERQRREEEERQREIEEARIRAKEEDRVRKEKEKEERREKAAITIQCWTRGIYAVRLLNELKRKREERLQREEEERRRIIEEEARIKAEEEERLRREEEDRQREIEEASIRAEEEERVRREKEEEEERMRIIEEALLRAEEEERLRKEKEEKERRNRAAITIQCWTRRVYAVRLLNQLKAERDEQRQREEDEKRETAAIKITSWICDRMTIRAAKKELEERRIRKEEEDERVRIEEQLRRIKAVRNIEIWYYSILSIRAARSILQNLREERWMREEEARIERERIEAEERERQEEESRRIYALREYSASTIQKHYRGWRMIVEAKEELERRRKRADEERLERERLRIENEERIRREEEARLEMERMRIEEEERLKREEEERLKREEEARIEMERWIREEEERQRKEKEERWIREEEARLERERIEREEEEKRLRDEEEARIEMERQLREEQDRLKREEEDARLEMERVQREEDKRREEDELRAWAARQREEKIYQDLMESQRIDEKVQEFRENRAAKILQSAFRTLLHKKKISKRTVELLERMEGTPRNENSGRMTIGGYSDDRLLAGVREIKRRQRKLSLTLYKMSSISRVTAAVRIQAWWKGILTRRRHRVEIELIAVRMKEYNENTDKVLQGEHGEAERAIPVSKRLENAKNFLQDPHRLYDIKVACYTIMSLCRLSSLYCERAIVLSLHSLLIDTFQLQADRSPAFEEIIEFGVHAVEEMVNCTTGRVREAMIDEGERLVTIASHQMMAFPLNKVIAPTTMKILRKCKEILPVATHSKVFATLHSYYLKKAEEKFGKLPKTDVRNKEFIELKKSFSK